MSDWALPVAGTSPEDAAQAWLLRLRSGEATRGDVAGWHAWLEASESHREAFERARVVWEGISPLGPLMAQLYAEDGMEAKNLSSASRSRAVPARRFAFGSVLAVAALAILWAVPRFAFWSADLKSGVGEITHAALPDGTTVWLDTDSALRLHFTERERRVELVRGQVWFEVHPEQRRPFVVRAGDGSATDIGTFFGVRKDGDDVRVNVIRGAVRVDWHQRDLLLRAGEAAKFGEATPLVATGKVNPDQIAWQSGHLAFDGQPLSEVLAEMDRYWPGRIVLVAPNAAKRPVSAMLSLHDLSAGLDALARSEGVRITQLTNYLVVVTDAPEG